MGEADRYEVLIIDSGEAGKYLAWTLAKQGRRTAQVERKMIGGSCPNVACLPSKNVIHGAKVASLAARAAEFGFVGGPPSRSPCSAGFPSPCCATLSSPTRRPPRA